ncbi:MAG: geranylgeranylglyceryl/heptaprenylglyceryl phosphate synthase [Candidatus Marinimicrobia bacterium]|nr:geranylgeranylglyceryl/heptaprenylglyceryl phosphate synthase [Candidatus Neomarinimicrobiota bacterium]
MSIFKQLTEISRKRGTGYIVLIDPDTRDEKGLISFVEKLNEADVDAIFIGGSLLVDGEFHKCIDIVKEHSTIPVIIFPGSVQQISPKADAILFLSIISGRNPQYLFGDHVIAAPAIYKAGIEPISTGYMLFDSGRTTTAEFITNTKPLPPHKPEIAMAHALAAQFMGMSTVYLEAGSGADNPVPDAVIKAVSSFVDIPVIVGGGIKTPEAAAAKARAGASFIVTGNVLDKFDDPNIIKKFSQAIHWKE